jgi:Family of unknown function (DUF6188)
MTPSGCHSLLDEGIPSWEMSDVEFLVGRQVVEIQDESRIVFVASTRPEPRLYADVGDYECLDADGTPLALGDLVKRTVDAASTTDGLLTLSFTDGVMLRCPPDPQYEAWQVVGGSPPYLVVCLPGGELAVWDKRHVPPDAEAEQVVEQLHDRILVEPEEPEDETEL